MQACSYLSSPYLPPEGNTITVALHCVALYSTTASCPIVPALRYIIGRRDLLNLSLHSSAFPHIAYNAPYSPQNALYWLFIFSWYNFPSAYQNRLQLNFAARTKMVPQQSTHLSIPALSQLRIHSLKIAGQGLMVGFIYFSISI